MNAGLSLSRAIEHGRSNPVLATMVIIITFQNHGKRDKTKNMK
jgi:hypothetical protein